MPKSYFQPDTSLADNFFNILRRNKYVWEIISTAEKLKLPNWYVGAGCLAQTVWNYFHGFEPDKFISDIDLVYFDDTNMSYESENEIINRVKNHYSRFPIPLDIKNQARIHLWYPEHFGYPIEPYLSVEEAIDTFPTTSTSIGIKTFRGQLNLYAPYGLEDLFKLVVKPNKKQITEEIYKTKVIKWKKYWPKLIFYDW